MAGFRMIVQRALKRRLLKRPRYCENCGRDGVIIVAHHDSYELIDALNVRWLCSKCHRRYHKEHPELRDPESKEPIGRPGRFPDRYLLMTADEFMTTILKIPPPQYSQQYPWRLKT
jgi:ribosomal protein S27AE